MTSRSINAIVPFSETQKRESGVADSEWSSTDMALTGSAKHVQDPCNSKCL